MKQSFLTFIFLLPLCPSGFASNDSQSTSLHTSVEYEWESVPFVGGGFVDGFILHPTAADVRYCRTDMGGAYRWNDNNKCWEQMLDFLPYDQSNLQGVESIAIDPNDPQRVYLACGTYTHLNGSILRSDDGGHTFSRTDVAIAMGGNENGRGNGERMMVNPLNSNHIWMGTRQDGLWRSTDGSKSWHKVKSFPDITESIDLNDRQSWNKKGSGIIAVVIQVDTATHTATLYTAVSLMGRESIFYSTDDGASWHAIEGQPTSLRPTHLVLSSDGCLYVTYADTPGPSQMNDGAVWCYDTKKRQWRDISPFHLKKNEREKQGFGYAAIAVDPRNPRHLIVSTHCLWGKYGYGDDELFRSTDGGRHWTPLFLHGYRYDHSIAPYTKMAPLHWMFDLEIDPQNSDHAMFTTGFGGWETFNLSAGSRKGDTIVWSIATRGVEETVPLELYAPPSGARLLSGVGDYGGVSYHDISRPTMTNYEPYFGNTDGVSGAWRRPELMVRVGVIFNHLLDVPAISWSEDEGRTWKGCKTSPEKNAESGHIAVNADGTAWIWTPNRCEAWRTTNKGESWQRVEGLPKGMRTIADKVNPLRFYAVDVVKQKLFVSSDAGVSFKEHDIDLYRPSTFKKGNDTASSRNRGDYRGGQDRIYAMPDRENDLWIAAYDGLFHLLPGTDYKTEQMSHVRNIYGFGFGKSAIEGGYPALYLIGIVDGQYGFFRSDDKGESWVRINDDSHQYGHVLHICGDMQEYGRVYIGTHGRGIITGKPSGKKR